MMNSTEESITRILEQIEKGERRSRQRTLMYTLIPICVAILVLLFIGFSIRQYQTQLTEIKNNSIVIQERVTSLQNQLDTKTDQLNTNNNNLKQTEQQLNEAKQSLLKANEDLQIAQEKVTELQNKAEEYQKQITTLEAQLNEVNNALAQAEESFSELNSLDRYKYTNINNAYSYINVSTG
jgi:chromosome segregation ATPase